MSNSTPNDRSRTSHRKVGLVANARRDSPPPGALSFLLQPESGAIIEVELVDHPVDLPQSQFEALLFESECEV